MADGMGKWNMFKSKDYSSFYPNAKNPDVEFDMLGLKLKVDQKFYTKFEHYT